ncbi:MAG: acyl-CoA thioesterase [Candidatus Eremiobacteraeota bacterium]|nr:acyl-CoA thioesterase [Candidatus Eremiobacteraeota bacterium]MBC5827117.1 acyl-CoA thioesterase [Candidatus Eremiobacteraeota bacterium]
MPVRVAFRDIDGMRHVNHAQYLTYCETARNEYWMKVTGIRDVEEYDFVLAELSARYHAPAHLGDELTVACRVTELRRSSFLMEHEIRNVRTAQLVAEVNTVQVMFDPKAGKSLPIPATRRQQIEEFEGKPLSAAVSARRR